MEIYTSLYIAKQPMNILLLGGGGREHALAWKIKQSRHCGELYIAPGNAGTAQLGVNVALDPLDFTAVKALVLEAAIGLVVVGPEEPLVRGIEDFFHQDATLRSIPLVGPSAAAAQLEGSKAFAKAFMAEQGIPTAAYRAFGQDELAAGLDYLATHPLPVVLKADGLAAGKGVLICHDTAEAQQAFTEMLGGKFGAASARVVVESFLAGLEFSVFVLTDGIDYQLLPVAKDYKRVGAGDTGLNTGGMGAVSPPPFVGAALMEKVEQRIVVPTIAGLQQRGLRYRGFIFLGLIRVGQDPYVIEYNCRLGDPETEVVLPRLENDLVELLLALFDGSLGQKPIQQSAQAAATVMLVAGGYPGDYAKGDPISGLDEVEGSLVFHAGTRQDGPVVRTNGGRVLALTTLAPDFATAVAHSTAQAAKIQYAGRYFRPDIGFDL